MPPRQQHLPEVQAFLQSHFASRSWHFTLPGGTGHETYLAHSADRTCFVKLGAALARYLVMADLDLTPPVLAAGQLSDGTSIMVQPYIAGRHPTRPDYRRHLEQFAAILDRTHHSPQVQRVLPAVPATSYRAAGLELLTQLQQRWQRYRAHVPDVADFVDDSLAALADQIQEFSGAGLVASHNDICNGNWLLSPEGRLYLIDLDSMSLDDPALDIGATLWWYYPPDLRPRFLDLVGYAQAAAFQDRMRVRMALHCLHISLPRTHSFDAFDPAAFTETLTDFRAALIGAENPQGYE